MALQLLQKNGCRGLEQITNKCFNNSKRRFVKMKRRFIFLKGCFVRTKGCLRVSH
ncbi:MAG: hypothetical protein LBL74_08550 [Bacteroidales bacterium]|nr:hypothetical protein [Bacteroidales bacterium]